MLPADARTSFSRTRNTYSIFACDAPPPPPSGSNARFQPGRFFAYLPIYCVRFFRLVSPLVCVVQCQKRVASRPCYHELCDAHFGFT